MSDLMTPEQLEGALREVGAARYHDRHPFHLLMNEGALTRGQLQAWAVNRAYYQSMIPVKDATIVSRTTDVALRRVWRQRLVDHDGEAGDRGGIDRWLRLCEDLGLERDYVASLQGVLPATRFAVQAYIRFCGERSLLEAIASSLTELFSPHTITARMSAMLARYEFISGDSLAYFERRVTQAPRDAGFALAYVKEHACTPEQQRAVLAALEFKCDVLWAQLDALHFAYVEPKLSPPGAFVPAQQGG